MCQLNVYVLKEDVPGIDVMKMFEHHKFADLKNITHDLELQQYKYYNCFHAAPMRCNCGSVIGMLSEKADRFKSYAEFLDSIDKTHIADLIRIKSIMQSPDYEKKLRDAIKTKNNLFNSIEKLKEPLRKFEVEWQEKEEEIVSRLGLHMASKMKERDYNALKNRVEGSQEFKALSLSYNDFVNRNKDLLLSASYSLDISYEDDLKSIDLTILKAENDALLTTQREFLRQVGVCRDMLKLTDHIKIFSFWQGEKEEFFENDIKETKTFKIDDLTIDDLVFLKYGEVITITK